MQNAKKRISAIMAVTIALVFVLSVLFVVFESEHNCSGDDCRICQTVNTCLHIFDNTTPDPAVINAVAAVVFALVLVIGAVSACRNSENLITLKVKLSD
ncbi:MAG: hypothetical protein IJI47_04330 [Eubacterium sp.]|nr:hypothetical protein [Eubacterium sp.]MBR0412774.1 hypothetical protein [Eubacterium sp.]